jgi:two-component sensor histidine kinase
MQHQQLFETSKPQACELRMVKNDGTAFWAHIESTVAQDADGIPVSRFVMSNINERKLAEEALRESDKLLRASLEEKDVLLKEVHHRVKNNLAAIMGLIDLQGQEIVDETARASLVKLSNRIRSMSLVHEQLYQSDNFARIDLQFYLDSLTAHLHSSYQGSRNIQVSVAAAGVKMGLDSAVPCGLLITELVTNAFKYAFPAGQPCSGAVGCEIAVSAAWDGAAYTLTVADNGVGLPAGLDWKNTKTLGLLLVKMLSQHQLRGKIEVDCTGGTTFRLRFVPRIVRIYE